MANTFTARDTLKTKLLAALGNATTADQIVKLSRTIEKANLDDDADLETALDTKVSAMAGTATTADIEKLAFGVKKLRTPAAAATPTSSMVAEGSSNLYVTDSRVRSSFSAAGDLSYNAGTGVLSYTALPDALTVYATVADLPASGVAAGAKGIVEENKKLYIFTGASWVGVGLVDQKPNFTATPDGSYTLTPGGDTVITLSATDPQGDPITYSHQVTAGVLGGTTVSQSGNVFTITGSSDTNDTDPFTLIFRASDGTNITEASSEFTVTFGVNWANSENNIVNVPASNSGPAGNSSAAMYGHNLVAHTGVDGKDYYIAWAEGNNDGDKYHEIYNMTDGVSIGWSDGTGNNGPGSMPKQGSGMIDATSYNGGDYYCYINEANGAFVKRIVPGEFTSAHQVQGSGNFLSLASGFSSWIWHISMHGQHLLVTRPGHGTVACIDWANYTLKWFGEKQSGGLNLSDSGNFPCYNSDIGETYAAIQDVYGHDGATQAGSVYIVDIQTGNEVAKLVDPNPRVNGRFGGESGSLGDAVRHNAIAISGDKVVVGSPIDGAGAVHIFDMPTGTLEFTIDSSTHASIATQVDGDTKFGEDITAHGDYALVSKMSHVYVIQISTGQVVFETSSLGTMSTGFTGNTLVAGNIGGNGVRYMKP